MIFHQKSFSHPVELFFEKKDEKISFCHGVALNEKEVVSAAHCLAGAEALASFYNVFIQSNGQAHSIEKFIPSKNFRGILTDEDSDLGLIILSEPMFFEETFEILEKVSYGESDIIEHQLQKGMSGSGLFEMIDGKKYLTGILSRRRGEKLIYSNISAEIIRNMNKLKEFQTTL